MIKTIIFDNQGVLTERDNEGSLQTFARAFIFDYEKLKPEYLEIRDRIDTGEVSANEFYELMSRHFEGVKDKKEVADFHIKLYEPRNDVYDFVKELKKNFNIALLTNFCDRFDEFNERWQLDEFIPAENIFVSSRLKMRKPDHKIFKHVLEVLDNKPEEVVFVDDNEKNVTAAKELGIHGIVYRDLDQLKDDLGKIINSVVY